MKDAKIVQDPNDFETVSATVVEKEHEGAIRKFVQLILYDKVSGKAIEKEVLVERE